MSSDWAAGTPKRSILRQFLAPVLLAVLMTGLGVAVVSKWAADRSSRLASALRMNNIGQIIAQGSYPKSSNVLENLKNLTKLEFVLLRDAKPSLPERASAADRVGGTERAGGTDRAGGTERASEAEDRSGEVAQATLKLESAQIAQLRATILASREFPGPGSVGGPRLMGELLVDRVAMRWSAFKTDSGWLVVLEPEAVRGDGWFVFALPLVTGVLSSIGIAVVAAWTARRLSQRIESLESEVAEIAEGKFIRRALKGPNDAIQSLQASLYSMGEQLEDSKRQIEINERTRLIHMIGSGLAHELRNHLAGARLALQTVEVPPADAEAIEICVKQLDLAETQIRRLLAIRPGGDAIDSASLSVQAILSSVVEIASSIASHHQVQLDVFSPPSSSNQSGGRMEDVHVACGASIVGVLLNVVLNGIEAVSGSHRADGTAGCVQVTTTLPEPRSCRSDDRTMVQWVVRDNGPGPSSTVAHAMFEPFATTKREGVGLGLAMCKHVVESTGGSIHWSRSEDWTQFDIRTPIALPVDALNAFTPPLPTEPQPKS